MNMSTILRISVVSIMMITNAGDILAKEAYAAGNYILHPNSLYYGKQIIYKGLYEGIWAKRNGKSKSRFNFQLAEKVEKHEGNKEIITYEAEKNGVKGIKKLLIDAKGVTLEYNLMVKPEAGSGEIGFYIPTSFILDAAHPTATATLNSIKSRTIHDQFKSRKIISQYKDGVIELQG